MSSPSRPLAAACGSGWADGPALPVSFLITLILVLGEARYGILGGYERLVIALGVAWHRARAVTPAARLVRERQSAYITR